MHTVRTRKVRQHSPLSVVNTFIGRLLASCRSLMEVCTIFGTDHRGDINDILNRGQELRIKPTVMLSAKKKNPK